MFMKQTRVWLVLTIVLSLLALASACGKKDDTTTTENAASPTGKTYSGDTGSVAGVITYTGTPPAPKKIDTSADPVCGQNNPNLSTEDTIVKDGKLANVFIYVKEGAATDGTKIGDYAWATPTSPVNLDQKGCHYVPHIMGVMTNQKIHISNSDPTQHNIHPTPKNNPEWNQTQPNGAQPIEKSFARAEILVPVKCNQHPWMKSYIGVLKHPFFAVSAEDGSYTIKGLPPGTYTVIAWKEGGATGSEKPATVTVAANGTAKADFAFGDAATASGPSSLQIMPAIEFPMLSKH